MNALTFLSLLLSLVIFDASRLIPTVVPNHSPRSINYFDREYDLQKVFDPCKSDHVGAVARIYVPAGAGKYVQGTANWITIDGLETRTPLFMTAAHNLFLDGELKAPLEQTPIYFYHRDETGACSFKGHTIKRAHTLSMDPRSTYSEAARDIAVLEVEVQFHSLTNDNPIVITPTRSCQRGSRLTMNSYITAIAEGILPMRSSCVERERPFNSPYPSSGFNFHACDTGYGSSGGVLYCQVAGESIAHSVHVDGEGESGNPFGLKNYNVSVELSGAVIKELKNKVLRKLN